MSDDIEESDRPSVYEIRNWWAKWGLPTPTHVAVLLSALDAERARRKQAEALLQSVRDQIKYEANSSGGNVARIDAFLAGGDAV